MPHTNESPDSIQLCLSTCRIPGYILDREALKDLISKAKQNNPTLFYLAFNIGVFLFITGLAARINVTYSLGLGDIVGKFEVYLIRIAWVSLILLILYPFNDLKR